MLFSKDQHSKIKKLHDSVKDSDALAKLAYEFGQIANYFDRANSPRSRNFLAQEDDVKYKEFLRKGIQVKAQLQREIEGLAKGMKAGQEIGYYKSYDNKTLGLLLDAISRLSWTSSEMSDNTGKKLAKELEDLYNKYKNLVVNGKRSFDSKTKDSKVKDDWEYDFLDKIHDIQVCVNVINDYVKRFRKTVDTQTMSRIIHYLNNLKGYSDEAISLGNDFSRK